MRVRIQRFGFDVYVDLYWPFECAEPEGVCIRDGAFQQVGGRRTECFGPSGASNNAVHLRH